jgi:hypothetical protein
MRQHVLYCFIGVLIIGGLVACAPRAQNIPAAYISPLKYMGDDWPCDKLIQEATYVGDALIRASGAQDSAARQDAWSVFLLGIPTSGANVNEAEVSRLKGEQEALRIALRDKDCAIPPASESDD